jgi:uncharacterized protein YecE (DUF72 family)
VWPYRNYLSDVTETFLQCVALRQIPRTAQFDEIDSVQMSDDSCQVTMAPQKDSSQKNGSGGRRTDHSDLRIGPAGWAYKDWAGVVYPAPRPKGFHEATYLAEFFDTVEINTSFYRPLHIEQAEQWIERVARNPRFMFTAKLWQRFTHDPSPSVTDEREVRLGFDVLRDQGKLGAVLLQFPFAFQRNKETVAYLAGLLRRFGDYPLVAEFRHATWRAPETFDLLKEHRAGFCNIDQPVIGCSLEPSAEVTSEIGYVRLHGRRYDTWFKAGRPRGARSRAIAWSKRLAGQNLQEGEESRHDFFPENEGVAIPAFERYNYLYTEDELLPWLKRVEDIRGTAKRTYVVTNNHYLGKGIVNALQLISILKGTKVAVPEALRATYPALNEIAAEPPRAPTLFPMQ